MNVTFAATRPATTPVLALPVAKGAVATLAPEGLDDAARAILTAAAAGQRFKGEAGTVAEAYVASGRVLLLGVGEGDDASYERAGGAMTARLLTSGVTAVAADLSGTSAIAAARFAAGTAQRAWRYDVYRTKLADEAKPTLADVTIVGAPEETDAAWAGRDAVTQGLALTKTLVTLPPNILYPESFVELVSKEVEGLGLEITVLDEAAMAELGMGALLGVSQGSRREARLLALRWNGAGEGDPALALVGKGVTFDTGGISIKPAAGMEDMKWDMGGAGAVAGAMKTLALRKARANVIGVMGLVENMPDGNAQRPGDVVTSMSGQTIEVINTDAEGRLVLCDCVTWVQRTHKVKTIVDLATLTGAMIISLGNEQGGLFANDDGLADQLLAASKASGDALWRFPMGPAYDKLIDSAIADMKNVGPRGGGSITAAQFIKRFVDEGVNWAHLDIAGMVWSEKDGPTWGKGATGYGVRLLDQFVASNFEG
ncbi:leucyl aminopeptidase [Sphingomonas jeddahensis]|uniref:Probable cytosol aminopeptidase n=1 Tax=Sphingomonas jeddahensis TaxID=1915074 RepID=A0A1V2ES23_9SPHN|nr:leucyl aminopeptidase [Sphingomonas jeddahensis]ONF95491.1 Cytosol aminopeptidase [Sphingomonas jeddahensis]